MASDTPTPAAGDEQTPQGPGIEPIAWKAGLIPLLAILAEFDLAQFGFQFGLAAAVLAAVVQAKLEPLAVGPREAARLLGFSERTLWSRTAPRGDIPAVYVGRKVLYHVADLVDWLERHKVKPAAAPAEEAASC